MSRSRMIENVLARYQKRLQAGEVLSYEDVVAAHKELMPELGVLLSELLPPATSNSTDPQRPLPAWPSSASRLQPAAQSTDGWVERQPAVPPVVSRHEVLKHLGRGGFADVWLARHVELKQFRALKILHPERFTDRALDALVSEAQMMAALPLHTNRVQVHDLARDGKNVILILSYVDGGTLSRRAPLPWERAVHYIHGVVDALGEMHNRGLVHRDIKPDNIFVAQEIDVAVLGDFGLATHAGGNVEISGTPGYLAPEMLTTAASERSDVFALAATLFHLVVGRPPFPATSLLGSLSAARQGLPDPHPNLTHVPADLADVLRLGLEPNPGLRPSLEVFRAHLATIGVRGLIGALSGQGKRRTCRTRLQVAVAAADPADRTFRTLRTLEAAQPVESPVRVPKGALLRLETTADVDGYLTIFHFGSAGDLTGLVPHPLSRDTRMQANQPQRLVVRMTATENVDYAAVIWTREPIPLRPEEWRRRLLEGGPLTVDSRGLEFLHREGGDSVADDWTGLVVMVEQGR